MNPTSVPVHTPAIIVGKAMKYEANGINLAAHAALFDLQQVGVRKRWDFLNPKP